MADPNLWVVGNAPALEDDREARASYLPIRDGDTHRTVEVAPGLSVDFDDAGLPTGVEILWDWV